MANKALALLVICLVIFPAILLPKAAEAHAEDAVFYSSCFKDCHDKCRVEGNGNTSCEMKCDTDCFNKEFEAKLEGAKLGLKLP